MRQAVEVYPVAPVGVQRPEDVNTQGAQRALPEEGEHVESAKSPLGKVKHKARKLKDKLKKVTGSSPTTSPHDHGNLVDDHRDHTFPSHPPEYQQDDAHGGADSYEEDDEEDDHILSGDDQSKYEQVRSTGAMDKPGDGSEVEVHGGVPASVLAASHGTYNNNAVDHVPSGQLHDSTERQHNSPLSPYKTAGPPGTLQAAPTEYRYALADDEEAFKGVDGNASLEQPKPSHPEDGPHTSHNAAFNDVSHIERPEDPSLEASSVAMPPSADMKTAAGSSDPPSSDVPSQKAPASSESPRFDMNVSYTDDIVKPNPEFGHSSSPTHNKIAVINEDLPAESREDVRLAPKEYGSQQNLWDKAVPENVPLTFEADELGASNTVAETPTSADVEDISASGVGQRFDSIEQEDHKSRTSGGGSGGTYEPPISAIRGERGERNDNESLVSENAPKTLETDTDRHPCSDTLHDGEQDNGRQARAGAGSFRTVESEKPLVTPIGDETREYRKDGENEGYLGVSNEDGSEQPFYSQSQSGTDAIAKLPVSDMSNDDGKLPFTHNVQPESNDQENWGKWSADKLNTTKDTVTTSLMGSDGKGTAEEGPAALTTKHDSETPLVTSVGNGNNIRNDANEMEGNLTSEAAPTAGTVAGDGVDKSEGPHVHEKSHARSDEIVPATAKEDVEFYDPSNEKDDVEYYDPNNADDNQFQEGFALGTDKAEEEVRNGTLAGSTGATATKLGLSSSSHLDTPSTENANARGREEDVSSSPQVGSEKLGQTGAVQGLKDTVTPSLGYGGVISPKPSNEHGTEGEPSYPAADEQASFTSSQQQTGGTLQGLKNVLASKLGYGVQERPAENEETIYNESGEDANAENAGNTSINEEQKGERVPSQQATGGGVLQGLRNAVASKLGYGGMQHPAAADNTERTRDVSHDKEPDDMPVVEQERSGGNPPSSYTQNTGVTAKD